MPSWLGLCGLLAAVVSMILDVAQFWKKVISLVLAVSISSSIPFSLLSRDYYRGGNQNPLEIVFVIA